MNKEVKINITDDVSLVTFNNVPANIEFISFLFNKLSENHINVDMISQSAPVGGHTAVSFTMHDDDMGKILMLMPEIREYSSDIKPIVNGGNTKMSIYGEFMRYEYGVASKIFAAAARVNAEIKLITTSEIDVSLLIPKNIENELKKAILDSMK